MRINFFGGPGTGKTTIATWLYSKLKDMKYSVEYVSEYVKSWAYQNRKINKYDQVYFFAKQLQEEYKFLKGGVKHIITDSPVLLATVYSGIYGGKDLEKNLINISNEYDNDYNCINFYLERNTQIYLKKGRYQSLSQAIDIDNLIYNTLQNNCNNLYPVKYIDKDYILSTTINALKKKSKKEKT